MLDRNIIDSYLYFDSFKKRYGYNRNNRPYLFENIRLKCQWQQEREQFFVAMAMTSKEKDSTIIEDINNRFPNAIKDKIASFVSLGNTEKLINGLKKIVNNTKKFNFFQSLFHSNELRTNKKIFVCRTINTLQEMLSNNPSDEDLMKTMVNLVFNISTEKNLRKDVLSMEKSYIEKSGEIYTEVSKLMKRVFGDDRTNTILEKLHAEIYTQICASIYAGEISSSSSKVYGGNLNFV